MESNFDRSIEVLQSAQKEHLYTNLLQQIRKDFSLANIDVKLEGDMEPLQLHDVLREKIYFLLLERFQQYLNLLYVVDISEKEIKKMGPLDAADASAQICFLILKREWQKVWLKHKYNS
ncbi:hypothetical protein [Flagellimonas onchidii]|uniref:hypothetical protein n=1 Tax=Flagellimonas onchidii TaxID=2562684 RepID=UPI0010A5AFD6|nr:hypothetical protein [Allomuricauda onchidii]